MFYIFVEILAGLMIVHGAGNYLVPVMPPGAENGFLASLALSAVASIMCAVGCEVPRQRRGRRVMAYCVLATFAALVVAAKALAAGLLACT